MTISEGNWRGNPRVVATQKVAISDAIKGTVSREYYDPESYDGYNCIVVSQTSEADMLNIVKAIKKICATYSPTSDENILDWYGGDYIPFNNVRFIFKFTIIVRRAGIDAY